LNIYYQGTKAGSFGIFHHSCWAANLDDVLEILKQKIQSESASFRVFGVAQGSKVCYMFRKA
jgi:hypothetical protein